MVLTHHSLKNQGKQPLALGEGEAPKLEPITEAGAGAVQEKEKARLAEIIEKVNDLFEGELTDEDKLVYVNNVIKGKLLEIRRARAAGDQQHEGAVRQLADALDRAHERHHGRPRRAHDDEQAGAGERAGAGGAEGRAARAGAAL